MSKRVNAVHYGTGTGPFINGLAVYCCHSKRAAAILSRGYITLHRPSVTCKRCLQALAKADLEAYKAARQ